MMFNGLKDEKPRNADVKSLVDQHRLSEIRSPFHLEEGPIRKFLKKREETSALIRLFRLQDHLIEHKFPYNGITIHEYLISCAGDIYREMTKRYPHYGYIDEKWSTLTKWCYRLGGLTWGDYILLERLMADPAYQPKRDQYLKNLHHLREETVKTPMNDKRKDVMLASLDMIEALIRWFESLRPKPPREQLDKLTEAISNYFPREFWAE